MKHWQPEGEIVRIIPAADRLDRRRRARGFEPAPVVAVLAAVFLGLTAVAGWQRLAGPIATGPDQPIEWDAVQALPKPAPDPADVAWEKRAQDGPAMDANAELAGAAAPRGPSDRHDIFVIDGDTFSMGGARIRVAGIDAPETHPARCADEARLGLAATEKLRALLASGQVRISGSVHDRYGRDVRAVTVGRRDVAEIMIGAGFARPYDGATRQSWC